MSVNGISFAGSPNCNYQTTTAEDKAVETPIFNSDATDSIEISKEKKGVNKGLIAGLAVGAAALATGIYAYKTGKANSKEGAKFGEILKKGFKEIGKHIKSLWSKPAKFQLKSEKAAAKATQDYEGVSGLVKTKQMDSVVKEFGKDGTRHSNSYAEWLQKNANSKA